MSLLRHPRPAGVAALLMLGLAAGPAFARTGLQSEPYQIPLQTAQADPADTQNGSGSTFDHGENGDDRSDHLGHVGHDRGEHDHGGHDHGGGRGR
ncbi:hypothetical protein [Inquilinus sp. Marseille-Q2685]|uniref:hypothetical protein n=1 Tax=Inquilinus sp. Marseille-Q2685 TaxID=2866581 RepID=UPI001CE3CCA4|nr:hypothetical protein [Inquilinus sp. Marseille-Q2685]